MIDRLISLLERRPSVGWIGSATSAAGSYCSHTLGNMQLMLADVPPVPVNLLAWMTAVGIFFAVVGGGFSALIQCRNWWRGRKNPPNKLP